ncbi:TPA: replication initiation protein [Vibrio parahaemolyticus]|nr:replication initiation protein [Vibrio parahaemolyticus]
MSTSLSRIDEEHVANLSRSLVTSNTTVLQQRLMVTAVATFVPSDSKLVDQLNSFKREAEQKIITHKSANSYASSEDSDATRTNDNIDSVLSNQRIMNNVTIIKNADADTLCWTPISAIECAKLYFSKNTDYLKFRFKLNDFLKFWSPEIINSRNENKPSYLSRGIINSIKNIASITYEVKVCDNGSNIKEYIPIFSKVSLVDSTYIDIEINVNFMPYLVFYCEEIKRIGYIALPLYLLKNATTEYTMKMWLLLLRRYHPMKGYEPYEVTIDIETLREELGVTNSYKNGNDLQKNVINRAVSDIIRISNSKETKDRSVLKLLKINNEKADTDEKAYYRINMRGRKTASISLQVDPSHMRKSQNKKLKEKREKAAAKFEKRLNAGIPPTDENYLPSFLANFINNSDNKENEKNKEENKTPTSEQILNNSSADNRSASVRLKEQLKETINADKSVPIELKEPLKEKTNNEFNANHYLW